MARDIKAEKSVEDGAGGILHALFGVGATRWDATVDGEKGRGSTKEEAIANAAAKKALKDQKR